MSLKEFEALSPKKFVIFRIFQRDISKNGMRKSKSTKLCQNTSREVPHISEIILWKVRRIMKISAFFTPKSALFLGLFW
jgi:hypothetical protein